METVPEKVNCRGTMAGIECRQTDWRDRSDLYRMTWTLWQSAVHHVFSVKWTYMYVKTAQPAARQFQSESWPQYSSASSSTLYTIIFFKLSELITFTVYRKRWNRNCFGVRLRSRHAFGLLQLSITRYGRPGNQMSQAYRSNVKTVRDKCSESTVRCPPRSHYWWLSPPRFLKRLD